MHIYDDKPGPTQGRLLRTVTESPWTDRDRTLMLAWRFYTERLLCPGGCGQLREKAHHWDNAGEYHTEPVVCHACTALAIARSDKPEKTPPVELHGLVYRRDEQTKPLPPFATTAPAMPGPTPEGW